MKTIEIDTVIRIRRIIASFVRGNRAANASSDTVTGRTIGGSLW